MISKIQLLGSDLVGGTSDVHPPFLISCDLLLSYKTQALNMLTTKDNDNYFSRESG